MLLERSVNLASKVQPARAEQEASRIHQLAYRHQTWAVPEQAVRPRQKVDVERLEQ